jgi:hypothetical protein
MSSDPDGDPLTFDVFMGTTPSNMTLVRADLATPLLLRSNLSEGTTYYWRVVAKDNHNGVTAGPVWTFTVRSNYPPNSPSMPFPANGSTHSGTSVTFRWVATDDDGDPLKFDVMIGTTSNPSTVIGQDISVLQLPYSGLQANTVYYWRVVVKDPYGGTAVGPVWNFSTPSSQDAGLILYMPFNGDASDQSGNQFNGSITGATFTSDRYGQPSSALAFDGNDVVTVPHSPVLNFDGASGFTVAAWIKLSGTQDDYAGIVAKGPTSTSYPGYMLVMRQNSRLGSAIGEPGELVVTGNRSLNDGQWHFVAVVQEYAGQTSTLYVDGVADASLGDPSISTVFDNTRPLFIGHDRNSSRWFRGYIDDVRIYDRSLSPEEINVLSQE